VRGGKERLTREIEGGGENTTARAILIQRECVCARARTRAMERYRERRNTSIDKIAARRTREEEAMDSAQTCPSSPAERTWWPEGNTAKAVAANECSGALALLSAVANRDTCISVKHQDS